jgi:hypothetical protein
LLADIVQQLGGQEDSCPMVVAPGKTADKGQDLIIFQPGTLADFFSHQQLVDVDSMSLGPSQLERTLLGELAFILPAGIKGSLSPYCGKHAALGRQLSAETTRYNIHCYETKSSGITLSLFLLADC